MNTTVLRPKPGGTALACAALLSLAALAATAQEHAHHQMTEAEFAELREKVPLYREYSDAEIIASMERMGPNFEVYLSEAALTDRVGILALGHGYEPSGNEAFKNAYAGTADEHPTAVALGMAMMTSDHIQRAVDQLTGAGADTILVFPITTLKNGGLIKQWQYVFGLREEAPWMSVPRVRTEARVIFGPTPSDDPTISAILLDYADEISSDPENEVVAILAHGPVAPDENAEELVRLETHAAYLRARRPFAEVRGFTLQDDAPSAVRAANVHRIRSWLVQTTESGRRAIVITTLPVTGSVHRKIRRDLDGLNYAFNEKGVVEHSGFDDWVNTVIVSAVR